MAPGRRRWWGCSRWRWLPAPAEDLDRPARVVRREFTVVGAVLPALPFVSVKALRSR